MFRIFSSVNDFDVNEIEKDKSMKGGGSTHTSVKIQSNGSAGGKWNNVKESKDSSTTVNSQRSERKSRQAKSTVDTIAEQQKQQDEYCQRSVTPFFFSSRKSSTRFSSFI